MSTEFIGFKYEQTKDLDIKEIAKLIRKDIANSGLAHRGKFGVRIERYSMGRCIHLFVKDLVTIYEDDRINIPKRLKEIANAYNYDRSDSMSDYYDVRFAIRVHWHVGLDKK